MRTRLDGMWVVGFQDGNHVIHKDASVVFEDDRIVHVGDEYEGGFDRHLNGEFLIIPGMINMHAHLDVAIGGFWHDRVREPNVYAQRPSEWVSNPDEPPVFTPAEVDAGARHSMATLLQTGTTTFADLTSMVFKRWDDPIWEPHIYAETAGELGLRAYLTHRYRSAFVSSTDGELELHWDEEKGRRGFERALRFADRYDDAYGGRINTMLFPYTLDTVTPELLSDTKEAADERGMLIRLHAAQSRFEVRTISKRHDHTPVEYLDDVGLLDQNVCLTHCLYPDGEWDKNGLPTPSDSALDRIAASGATVVHCPLVYRRHGEVLNSFSRYRNHGIPMALGTDTAPQNIVEEMRWAALCNKWVDSDPSAGSAMELFDAVTLGGARALGRTDIGRLTPGAKADIVVVDLSDLHVKPYRDPIKALVHYTTPKDILHVFINGEHVVTNGSIPGLNERRVLNDVQEVYDKMGQIFVEWSGLRDDHSHFPTSYPLEPAFDSRR